MLDDYLDLCATAGVDRVEAGSGFTDMPIPADQVIAAAAARGLAEQYEIGGKHDGPFTDPQMAAVVELGQRWLDAGARSLVVEARESARAVGLFDTDGAFQARLADVLADAFGLTALLFEAPDKRSQFTLLEHFGPALCLSNVRLEELLRVEIYRRGMHSDSFGSPSLGLCRPSPATL